MKSICSFRIFIYIISYYAIMLCFSYAATGAGLFDSAMCGACTFRLYGFLPFCDESVFE